MPATGTKVDRIEVDWLKNSTLPALTCDNRSVSEPSWLAGNSLMSSLPPVASRIRSSASWARVFTGCFGSCPVASLYSNSAAKAERRRMAGNGIAMPTASNARRVIPRWRIFEVIISSSAFWALRGRSDRSRLLRLPRLDFLRHGFGRDAVTLVKAWQSPRVQELIRKPDLTEYRSYPRTQQQAGNCLTEATDGRVVLGYDYHPAASRGLLSDGRLVERLDGGHMQHADIDPVVPRRLRGLERAHGHEARRDDQRIAPIAKELGFPQLELIVVFVEKPWDLATPEPHVDRTLVGSDCGNDLLDLVCIARIDNRQVRHPPEDRNVLRCLMARPVARR